MKRSKRWALCALVGGLLPFSSWAENTSHDVIIVGAGAAGLYAAKTLNASGYRVLVIEATDRIGGRIYSKTLGSTRIELGAEEHYLATGGNPVFPAITEAYGDDIYVDGYQGIEAYSMDDGAETCWYLASAPFDCSDDEDVVKAEDVYDWYWRRQQHRDPTTTLADDVLEEYQVGPEDRAYHIYDATFAGGSFATNLYKIGARSLALQDTNWDLSDDIQVIGDKNLGYSDALDNIWWDDVLATSDFIFSAPVTAIDTRGDDVIVTDANGDLHAARQVIVTVSIGVLQAEHIDFIPDLPQSTVDAYNGIGIDHGMKVAIRFDSVWWETEGQPLAWLGTEGVAGACWVPTDYKIGSSDHIFMCYPMGDNGRILTEFASDGYSDADGDQHFGDDAIVQAILDDLDVTFSQFATQAASGAYLDHEVQNWGAHPHTLGVYSFPKVGTFTSASDNLRADLQLPVAGNRIYFAGEGSHITHPATVVGALHEGERAANQVSAINGSPNDPPPIPGTGGGTPDILVTGSSALGDVNVGDQQTATLTIENLGDASLSLGNLSGLAAPFSIATDACSANELAPAGSCAVTVSFTPASVGVFGDSLDIPSNDPDEPMVSISFSGTGTDTGGGDFSELLFDDFESGFGNWTDGGRHAVHYSGGKWATGNGAIRLRRNGADATMSTANLALASSTEVEVTFDYRPRGLDAGEYFQLQISTDGGNSYQMVQQWTRNVDFANREYQQETVLISGISLSNETRLRFRCYGNENNDRVYIDEVRISAKMNPAL